MDDQNSLDEFRGALARWKEGCLFYFKFDLALIATISAVISYLKLERSEVLLATHEYRALVNWLVAFLIYALVLDLNITNTANRIDLAERMRNSRWHRVVHALFRFAYSLQVIAHTFLIVGASAYLLGYSDGFAHLSGTE